MLADRSRHSLVIVVDDEPLIRLVLRGALERDGHTVLDAENGADAIVLARDNTPDAAILDARMPGLTLAETIAGLRGLRTNFPVLVLSGDASAPAEATGPNTQFLRKPADTPRLLGAVRELIDAAERGA